MNGKRVNRISSEIKKIISSLILTELKDPRITNMTSVSYVKVSNDLSFADVFISVLGDERTKKESLEGLEKAKGFIKKELGSQLDLRHIPELRFRIDESLDRGMHIEELLAQIKKEDNNEA